MGRGNIKKYGKGSNLMNISINYGEEEFHFNLIEELVVDENMINGEIKEQPSAYAFLSMLHKKLIRRAKDKEKEMEKTYADMFIKYKNQTDLQTHKPLANDLAKEKAIASLRYQNSIDEFIEAQHQSEMLAV